MARQNSKHILKQHLPHNYRKQVVIMVNKKAETPINVDTVSNSLRGRLRNKKMNTLIDNAIIKLSKSYKKKNGSRVIIKKTARIK